MDAMSVAALSTAMAQNNLQAQTQVAVFKKAMDAQASVALGLIAALPQAGPAHLGRNFDAKA